MGEPGRRHRAGLLLSQIGSYASDLFAEGASRLGVTPAEAGVVRLIGRAHGLSQRRLADRLGAPPSRLVAILDRLEARGLVVRSRSASDRRNHALLLTPDGERLLERLGQVVAEQERALFAPLQPEEYARFVDTLAALAQAHGLDAEVHRGYSAGRQARREQESAPGAEGSEV